MRKESASDVKAGAGAGVAHLQSSASMLLLNVLVAFVNIPLSVCYCSYTVIRFTKHDHFESISLSLSFSQLVLKVLGVTALTFGNYVMMKMQRSVAIPSSSISLTTAITSANTISTNLPPYMKYHLMFCVFFYMGTLVRLFDSCILMDVWDFENHTEGISQALVVVLKWYEGEHHSHHQFLSFSVLCTLFFPLLFQVIFHDTFLVYPVGSGFWFACFTSLLIVVVYHRSLPMESVKVSAKGSHRSARVFGGMKATSRDISDDEGLVQARNPSRVTNDHGCHNLGENIGTSRAHNTIRSLNMSASHSRRMTELQKLVMLRSSAVSITSHGRGRCSASPRSSFIRPSGQRSSFALRRGSHLCTTVSEDNPCEMEKNGLDDSATMTTVEQSSNLLLRHKVIGVSANDDEETEHAMMEVGFDACLPKPFTVDMLQEVVEDLDLNPSGSHN
eukprot:gene10302-11402_t